MPLRLDRTRYAPITHVSDSALEMGGTEEGAVAFIKNGIAMRQGVRVRPGLLPPTVALGGTSDCQMIQEFTRATDGTRLIAYVLNGLIYVSTDGGYSWSNTVTAADFSTAGITRTTTGNWQCCVFNGTLVINDGTNRPFQWNGASGSGGLTSLSNAPATVLGRPTVYYGKVFFLKTRFVIVWSEENAANLGYEAGGYNNAWTLSQNDSDALYALLGTNEGLYYFRRDSIGIIRGAVTPDFSTTGVQDGVSEAVGSTSSMNLFLGESHVWFPDALGRPWALPRGGGPPVPLYRQLPLLYGEEALGTVIWPWYALAYPSSPGQLVSSTAQVEVAYHAHFDLVAFTVDYAGAGFKSLALFSQSTLRSHGVWEWPLGASFAQRLSGALVMDAASGTPKVLGLIIGAASSRTVYLAQTARADVFTTTQYPELEIWGRPTHPGGLANHHFVEMQVLSTVLSENASPPRYTQAEVQYLTSNTPLKQDIGTALVVTKGDQGDGSNYGQITNVRLAVGINGYGRWLVPKVRLRRFTGAVAEEALDGVFLQDIIVSHYAADLEVATR